MMELPNAALVFPGVFVLAAEQCLFAIDFDADAALSGSGRLTSVHCVSSGSVAVLLWFGRHDAALVSEARGLAMGMRARLASSWCWMHILAEMRREAIATLVRHRATVDSALATGPPLFCYYYEQERQRRRRLRLRSTAEALQGIARSTSLPFHEDLQHSTAWDGLSVTWGDIKEDVAIVAPRVDDLHLVTLMLGLAMPVLRAEVVARPDSYGCCPSSRLGMAPEFHSRTLAFMAWVQALWPLRGWDDTH